ncbi:MAG: M1 family metallopeptidase [Anaerolineales bacterium]|nr:M1 family metallopeptidase [Anaerolineales bacterium]
MKRRRTLIVMLAILVMSGCLPPVELGPTRTPTRDVLEGTQALPPAFTPTPSPPATHTPQPTPEVQHSDQQPGLLPDHIDDLSQIKGATRYSIDVQVTLGSEMRTAVLDGWAQIQFQNQLDHPLHEIYLMLWPNDSQYQASMVAGPVFIRDKVIDPKLELAGLALRVDLPLPLAPGEMIDLGLPFRIEVESMRPSAPRRFGITEGVLIAPTFYPLIPRIVDDEWDVRRAPPGGDTTNSEIALYQLRVTAPAAFDLVASGVEILNETIGDLQRLTYVTGPMRDIAIAVADFVNESRQVGDVTVTAWVLEDHADDLDKVLDSATLQMQVLGDLVGPYPYPELDIVDAPAAFGGIEYPGLVFIGTVGTHWVVEPTVHEVAHQWFYALIGDDQISEPWLDEAAATYAEALYYERALGSGRATGFLSDLRAIVREHSDPTIPIGLPVGDYASVNDYAVFVYMKGALFFDALRRELGDRSFREFLKAYYEQYRYGFASGSDFQEVAEETCRCNLQDLFDLWVYVGGSISELER